GAIAYEDDGADHFIAPLHVIDTVELELAIIRHRFHPRGSPLHPMMVCGFRSDSSIQGLLRPSAEHGGWSLGLITCWVNREGLLERGGAGWEEGSDGETAGIPIAETHPQVVSGRLSHGRSEAEATVFLAKFKARTDGCAPFFT